MCMVYFLQVASPIRTVPWDPDRPAFHVGRPSDRERGVVDRFPDQGPVYYLGSHLQCGCGFRCDTLGEEPDETEGKQSSHEALARFVSDLPGDARPVYIYGVWSGDEDRPIDGVRAVAAERLAAPDFSFRERELVRVMFDTTDGDENASA